MLPECSHLYSSIVQTGYRPRNILSFSHSVIHPRRSPIISPPRSLVLYNAAHITATTKMQQLYDLDNLQHVGLQHPELPGPPEQQQLWQQQQYQQQQQRAQEEQLRQAYRQQRGNVAHVQQYQQQPQQPQPQPQPQPPQESAVDATVMQHHIMETQQLRLLQQLYKQQRMQEQMQAIIKQTPMPVMPRGKKKRKKKKGGRGGKTGAETGEMKEKEGGEVVVGQGKHVPLGYKRSGMGGSGPRGGNGGGGGEGLCRVQ